MWQGWDEGWSNVKLQHTLGAEPWILFGARNFNMICVSLCVTQAWQLCQTLCRFASWFWQPHPHFHYWEKYFYRRRRYNVEGAENETRQCSSQMYALIWDMYSYRFGHIIKHFPDMAITLRVRNWYMSAGLAVSGCSDGSPLGRTPTQHATTQASNLPNALLKTSNFMVL